MTSVYQFPCASLIVLPRKERLSQRFCASVCWWNWWSWCAAWIYFWTPGQWEFGWWMDWEQVLGLRCPPTGCDFEDSPWKMKSRRKYNVTVVFVWRCFRFWFHPPGIGLEDGWRAQHFHLASFTFHVVWLWSVFLWVAHKDLHSRPCTEIWQFVWVYGVEVSFWNICQSMHTWPPPVRTQNRELGADFKSNVQKYIPMLRQPLFGLMRAADWLEGLITGTLEKKPLLDVWASMD